MRNIPNCPNYRRRDRTAKRRNLRDLAPGLAGRALLGSCAPEATRRRNIMAQPLERRRIPPCRWPACACLDVSQVMAGPFCSMLLGDMGADVIKIEPPDGGDQTRRAMGFKLKGTDQPRLLQSQPQQAQLDAQSQRARRAREVFYRLVETADILIENYRPGVTKRLSASIIETLTAINPRLIYASISGSARPDHGRSVPAST